MEIAYVSLQGVNLKLVGIVEDGEKLHSQEIFGFELMDVLRISALEPHAILITSLINQAERMEKVGPLAESQGIKIYRI